MWLQKEAKTENNGRQIPAAAPRGFRPTNKKQLLSESSDSESETTTYKKQKAKKFKDKGASPRKLQLELYSDEPEDESENEGGNSEPPLHKILKV
uniref:Uncharacterized protein n=1 Tax=Amphimedon queenslandica TaxID=400682 RepID=A0A1X7U1T0_AMPQE